MKDLIARLRYNWGTKPEFHKMCREAADALEAQQAEIETLRADAERYRWLRELPVSANGSMYLSKENLDSAIDAARRK